MHQQHIDNTEAAISAWATVPPETVVRNLKAFRQGFRKYDAPSCQSPACFGGWLPYFDHFAKLGVISDEGGSPIFAGHPELFGHRVSSVLFGSPMLFNQRGALDTDSKDGTDHEIVMTRLLSHLAVLRGALLFYGT